MILLGLKLRIDGFWACSVSEEFKGTLLKILDIHPSKDYSRGLLAVFGEVDLKKVSDFLSLSKDIERVDILLDDPDSKLLAFYFKHGPLGDIVVKTGVHIRPPLELEKGLIKVNLIGTSKSIYQFLNESEKLKNITMEIIRRSALKCIGKPRLTRQQELILRMAIKLGYYDLPRRITNRELAKKLGLSASTVAEHLRKVENRIISDYI
ncbi:helix-turn-helix domain-containing protein [[Eubacterium] cellulosolvens]